MASGKKPLPVFLTHPHDPGIRPSESGEPNPSNSRQAAPGTMDQGLPDIIFSDFYMEAMRKMYKATGNPIPVWWAIWWHTNETSEPLPGWCMEYLAEVASKITDLADGRDFRDRGKQPPPLSESRGFPDQRKGIDWQRMRELVPAALGLTGAGNNNAFRDAHGGMRAARAAAHYARLTRSGTSAKEAEVEIIRLLGISDDSAARKIIRDGKKLLKGERVKPNP